MPLVAYRLRPKAPLHLGTGRAGDLVDVEDLPRSDTLFSALVSVWSHVAGTMSPEEISRLAASPPFAVSSALPATRVGSRWEPYLFTPAGLMDLFQPNDRTLAKTPATPSKATATPTSASRLDERAFAKALRRVRFVRSESLTKLLAPNCSQTVLDAVMTEHDALSRSLHRESRLRLEVDRLSGGPVEGRLFELRGVRIDDAVRLVVVVRFHDASVRPTFEAALRLLGDEGIGGERSVGFGAFEVEGGAEEFASRLGQGARLSLSLLHPSRAEIEAGLLDAPASYDFAVRGGWTSSLSAPSLRRRELRMLAEGSVVRDLGRERYGDSVRVLETMPELGLHHPVYRSGAAVTIPISPFPEARA